MGSGIAQVIANAGFEVILQSRKGNAGLERLQRNIQKAKDKGVLNEVQSISLLSNISCTSSLREAVCEVDLVVEAVAEDIAIKRSLFGELDAYCMPHTILASNTSSLSISRLAEATLRVEKVVGMHFFNPAPIMKLIELVQTSMTSKETIESVIDFSHKIGKVPLIVKDSPGFIVNKTLMPMINSAAFTLMEKVATAEDIDSAIKLGANHPMGPLALADLIGVDVCLNIMKELDKSDHLKYPICPLISEMVAQGNLGRKTGRGFFLYMA